MNIPFFRTAPWANSLMLIGVSGALASAALAQESTPAPAATPEASVSAAAPAPQPAWKSIAVYPPVIKLSAKSDTQHVIAVATREDGVTQDVTRMAEWKFSADTVADWKDFVLSPKGDGTAELTATWNGQTAKATIESTNSSQVRPISFERDVMPVLTKVGCNTGSCHGAARGKDGFRLSLFGTIPSAIITVSLAKSVYVASILRYPTKAFCSSKPPGLFSTPAVRKWSLVANITTPF